MFLIHAWREKIFRSKVFGAPTRKTLGYKRSMQEAGQRRYFALKCGRRAFLAGGKGGFSARFAYLEKSVENKAFLKGGR
jgi:hypothetical protein